VDATAEAGKVRAVEPDAHGMEVDDGRAAPDMPAEETKETEETPALSIVLESVLFVASEPVTPAQLARSLQVSEAEVQAGLAALADHYRSSGRGLQLQQLHGKVQLVTAPAVATYVEAFLNLDATARLSGPALETLAVVAYRQPVTRAQVEAIRGVDCAGVLRSLVQRGLIAEVGRLESVGRPILYGVTELFMQHFGLADLKDLPPLEENEADRLWAATLLAEPDSDIPGAVPSDSQATGESLGGG
jgi:segregation and condensation protein B